MVRTVVTSITRMKDVETFTRYYGSLATFNILFKNREDQFRTSAMGRMLKELVRRNRK